MDTVPDTPTLEALAAVSILEAWEDHPAVEVLDAAYAAPVHLRRALSGRWGW
ncbi:hypothetical protein [Streptomyces viridochromogenes]|uniref:hypothetical protein n=1 Tax=Streptomyces viridochromogenes TaxID=1938 RepID=UPI000AE64778|nr:hypothetical protein [Streptomyces viridochromogenes]